MLLKQRGAHKAAPGARDGRWIITLNRTYVYSGKLGWSGMVMLRGHSAHRYFRPGGNACLYDSRETAEAIAVAESLFEQSNLKTKEQIGSHTGLREAHRNSGQAQNMPILESAQIKNNAATWPTFWALGNALYLMGPQHYSAVGRPMPGIVTAFTSEEDARRYYRAHKLVIAPHFVHGIAPCYVDEFGNVEVKDRFPWL